MSSSEDLLLRIAGDSSSGQKAIADLQGQLAAAQKDVENIQKAFAGLGPGANGAQLFQEELGKAQTKVAGLQQQLQEAKVVVDDHGQSLEKLASTLTGVGTAMHATGTILTTMITAPLVAAALAGEHFAADFQTQMVRVQTLAGASATEVAAMRGEVLKLAPAVGVGPADLAKGLFVLESAGQRGAQALETLTVAGKMSAIGMGQTSEVARSLIGVMLSYQNQNLSAAQAGDILVKTVQLGNMKIDELVPALARVNPLAAAMGIKFQDVSAAIATFTHMGASSEVAATGLRAILSNILNDSAKTEKGFTMLSKALGDTTITMGNFRKEIADRGLAQALIDLMEKANAAGEKGMESLNKIFPNIKALTEVLANAKANGAMYLSVTRDMYDANGTLNKSFEETQKTFDQRWKEFKAQMDVVLITFGNDLLPTLQRVVDFLRDTVVPDVKALVDAFSGLPEPVKTAALVFGALAAAAGPAIYVLGSLVGAAGNVVGALAKIPGATTMVTSAVTSVTSAISTAAGAWVSGLSSLGTALAGASAATLGLLGAIAAVAAYDIYKIVQGAGAAWDIYTNHVQAATDATWNQQMATRLLDEASRVSGGVVTDLAAAQAILREHTEDLQAKFLAHQLALKNHVPIAGAASTAVRELTAEEKKHEQAVQALVAAFDGESKKTGETIEAIRRVIQSHTTNIEVIGRVEDAIKKLHDQHIKIPPDLQAWETANRTLKGTIDALHGKFSQLTLVIPDNTAHVEAMRAKFEEVRSALQGTTLDMDLLAGKTESATEKTARMEAGLKKVRGEIGGDWLSSFTKQLDSFPDVLIKSLEHGGNTTKALEAFGLKLGEAFAHGLDQKMQSLGISGFGAPQTVTGDDGKEHLSAAGVAFAGAQVGVGLLANATQPNDTQGRGGAAVHDAAVGAQYGAIAGPIGMAVGAGIGAIIGALKVPAIEIAGRKVEADFEGQFGSFQKMMDAVGAGYVATGHTSQQAQADVKALMAAENQGAAATQTAVDKINAILKQHADDVQKGVAGILDSAKTVGSDFPSAMKPMIDSLLAMPGLTDAEKNSLLGLTGAVKPNFDQLTQTAKGYGLSLTDLGPSFEQANISGRADTILTDFKHLVDAGADADHVLHGMGGSIDTLVQNAITYGSTLPTALQPLVQQLFDTGQLSDGAGGKLKDLSGLKFDDAGDPLATGMKTLTEAITHLSDLLSPSSTLLDGLTRGIPAGATTAAGVVHTAAGGMVSDLNTVSAAVDRVNFGSSPGGIKEIPILLDKASSALAVTGSFAGTVFGGLYDDIQRVTQVTDGFGQSIDAAGRRIGALPSLPGGGAAGSGGAGSAGASDQIGPQDVHDLAVKAFTGHFGHAPTTTQLQALATAAGYTQGTTVSRAWAVAFLNSPAALNAVGDLHSVFRAAGGGIVPGYFASGTDTVPAMLTPGEAVLTRSATAALGPKVIQLLNRGTGGIDLSKLAASAGGGDLHVTVNANGSIFRDRRAMQELAIEIGEHLANHQTLRRMYQ